MPLISSFSAVASAKVVNVSFTDALLYSVLGIAIVFAVLIILMAFIGIMSKAMGTGKAKEVKPAEATPAFVPAPAPAPAPAAVATTAASNVPDGAMFVTLNGTRHTVSVTEKLPRFTVKVNGKAHFVDVEPVGEDE